jgi:hypothetical protein
MTRFRFLDAQGVATPDPAQTVVFQDLETRLDWIATPIMLASQREIEAQASAIGLLGGGWLAPSRVQLLTLVDDTRFRPATFPELASFTPLDDCRGLARLRDETRVDREADQAEVAA